MNDLEKRIEESLNRNKMILDKIENAIERFEKMFNMNFESINNRLNEYENKKNNNSLSKKYSKSVEKKQFGNNAAIAYIRKGIKYSLNIDLDDNTINSLKNNVKKFNNDKLLKLWCQQSYRVKSYQEFMNAYNSIINDNFNQNN